MSVVQSINVGRAVNVNYKNKNIQTGICKNPVQKPIYLTKEKFEGDEQADLVHHGGVDKAVCVYPLEHYTYWEKEVNKTFSEGAFGENLTVRGLSEKEVCIGDTYQIGDAIVQVSQPRQPCFKLAAKHGVPDLPALVEATGYTGYYFRVTKEGLVEPGPTIHLLEKHPLHVTVAYANQIMYRDKHNLEGIQKILEVNALSASWRKMLSKRLIKNEQD